jgi:hypothetical protein
VNDSPPAAAVPATETASETPAVPAKTYDSGDALRSFAESSRVERTAPPRLFARHPDDVLELNFPEWFEKDGGRPSLVGHVRLPA